MKLLIAGWYSEKPVVPDNLNELLAEYAKGINFDLDKANITLDSAKKLDMVYELISPIEDVIFVIEGYTDNTASAEYNKYLSERRSESAKAYLVKKGTDASKLETIGFGEKNPAASNSTKSGRAINRRVVIKLRDM